MQKRGVHSSGWWSGCVLWAVVLLPALEMGCQGNGTGAVDGGSRWPGPEPGPGISTDLKPSDPGSTDCVTLTEMPVAPSAITWSGFPACDGAGFCLVHPAPMNSIRSVAVSPSGTKWAVYQNVVASWKGSQGKVIRYDLDDNADIEDIFALSDTDVWLVGAGSRVVHYDGTRWTAALVQAGSWLKTVWASGAADVWAGGNFNAIAHFDGTAWTATAPGSVNASYSAIHGTGPRDVWAVGGGDVLHYNGTSWAPITLGKLVSGVWAAAPNDVIFAGVNGVVLRGSIAGGFTQQTLPAAVATEEFGRVWGSSANDVWVSSRLRAVHWDGTAWTVVPDIQGIIRGRSATDVVAVDATQARTFDGSTWTTAFSLKDPQLKAAWAASADDLWFVGKDGFVLHSKNGVLSRAKLRDKDLVSIWGASANDIVILDEDGIVHRGDGKKFCATPLPTADWTNYGALSGTAANDIWAVTGVGDALHYDGQKWSLAGTLKAEHVLAIAPNDVWASGEALHRWDGSKWNQVIASTGFASEFGPIWAASPNDVWTSQKIFFGGDNSMHWTGSSFTQISNEGQASGTLAGSAPNDIWSFGFYHKHWDGTKWNKVQTPRLGIKASVATSRDVWAVGDQGLVLRRSKM